MTTLTNSFEGGTSGTTITTANSGGTSGTAFDAVTTGANTTNAFDNTHAAHGTLAYANASGATSTTAFLEWSSTGNTTNALAGIGLQIWYRAYLYITANPTTQYRIVSVLNGSTVVGSVLLTTAGKLITTNTAGGTVTTSTASVPLNQWFRIEGYFLTSAGNSTGQLELKLFNTADSATADEIDTSAANLVNSTAITRIRFGLSAALASNPEHWFDDVGASTTGYIGPAVTAATPYPVVFRNPPDIWTRPAVPPAPQIIGITPTTVTAVAALSGSGSLGATPSFSGTATLSGTGTLTAAPALTPTTGLSGAGTLTAGPALAATAALTGTGTLSAVPTAPAGATLTGTGTLTAAPSLTAAAALSGAGSLTATAAFATVATMSGAGTLTASPVQAAIAVLSGSGTLTASPQVIGTPRSAVLSVVQPRPPPPAPAPQILPGVQQDFLVVLADMQPAQHTGAPPTVVAAQVAALNPQPAYVLIAGDCTNDGDNTGFTGEFANFNSMYGGIKAILRPVPGNHDWGNVVGQGNLTAYDTYWGAQAHAGATPPHFYSFDTPSGWHVVALDSDEQWVGSLNSPSSTYAAVAADLAANRGKPLIAYWHHPRFSDGTNTTDPGGTGDTTTVQDIWNLLRDYACDLVFVGHCHSYQRFGKLGKTGTADSGGIREFVVGSGGSGLFTLTGAPGSPARSEVNSWQSAAYDQLNSKWFGFLKLYLTPTTYSWQFVSQNAVGSEAPGQVLDSGGPVQTNLSQGAVQPVTVAELSGTGTLGATPSLASTAALSGTGSLTATSAAAGTAVLSGSGTLGASPALAATASLSGSGTLGASPAAPTNASLSGTGSLAASPVLPGAATLAGTGTLAGTPASAAGAAMSGTGTLAATAALSPQAPLSGTGTLAATWKLATAGALAGTGTLAVAVTWGLTGTLSGAGTLTGAGIVPPPFTVGTLTGTDEPQAVLTAGTSTLAGGTLAASDQSAGGPS